MYSVQQLRVNTVNDTVFIGPANVGTKVMGYLFVFSTKVNHR